MLCCPSNSIDIIWGKLTSPADGEPSTQLTSTPVLAYLYFSLCILILEVNSAIVFNSFQAVILRYAGTNSSEDNIYIVIYSPMANVTVKCFPQYYYVF